MNRELIILLLFIGLASTGMLAASNPADYDESFASPDGYTTLSAPDMQCVTDLVADSTNNVYLALTVETSDSSTGIRPAVMKLSPDGTVDSSFGTNGMYVIPSDIEGTATGSYVDIGLATDGKIYVSFPGSGGTPSSKNFFLCRILADGSGLDGDFSTVGCNDQRFEVFAI